MDIHFHATAVVYTTETHGKDAPSERCNTEWVIHDAASVPGYQDYLQIDGEHWSRWKIMSPIRFDPMMQFAAIDLYPVDHETVLDRAAWDTFLKAVGDLQQLGLSPLGPVPDTPPDGPGHLHRISPSDGTIAEGLGTRKRYGVDPNEP